MKLSGQAGSLTPSNTSPPSSAGTMPTESMLFQCFSPVNIPEVVSARLRDIENEQRELIAERDKSCIQSESEGGKYEAHSRGVVPDGANSNIDAKAVEYDNSAPRTAINHSDLGPVTPPSSTTSQPSSTPSNISSPRSAVPPTFSLNAVASPQNGQAASPPVLPGSQESLPKLRSFGGRRSKPPPALNVSALRRERQFSGPYSANPMLPSKKQCTEDKKDTSADQSNVSEGKDEEEGKQNLQETPNETATPLEPDPSNPSKIRLPLISELVNAPYIAPPNPRLSKLLWSPLSTPTSMPTTATAPYFSAPMSSLPDLKDSRRSSRVSISPVQGTGSNLEEQPGSAALNVAGMTKSEQKRKYMETCSEMWDLLHG